MLLGQSYILVANLGQTGITSVVIQGKKPSATSFEEIVQVTGTFVEAEEGYYNITVPKEFINELGTYVFKVSAYEVEKILEKEAVPVPPYSTVAPDICVVSGNLKDVTGGLSAYTQISIEARPLKLPYLTNGTHLLGQRVSVYADFNGDFQLPLTRGTLVLIEIKDAGIRFQAEVPDQSNARIEDLIPNM